MDTGKRTRQRRWMELSATLCTSIVLSLPSVLQADAVERALDCAVAADADFLLSVDLARFQDSQIQKQAAEIRGKTESFIPGNPLTDLRKKAGALQSALGVDADGVNRIVISASTGDGGKLGADLSSMNGLMAASLKTPLTIDEIEAGLNRAENMEGVGKPMGKVTHKSIEMLALDTGKMSADGKPVRAFMAPLADGHVIYLGSEAAVRTGLDRFLSGEGKTTLELLEIAAEVIPDAAQVSLVFVPAAGLRERVRKHAVKAQQTNPMMANTMASISEMKYMTFYLTAKEAMDMELSLSFRTQEEALQVKTMLDMMVLGMGKMTLMQALGKTIPMIESLTCGQKDMSASISMRITSEDLAALAEIGTGTGAEMGFPAPEKGAPPAQGIPAEE